MAQVPYQPYSNVTPLVSGERLNEATPDNAFGVNVGRAIEHLGTTGQEVGNELYQRATALQELQNETMAREQSVKTTQQMAERYEEFKKLGNRMGDPGMLTQFYSDIEKMRVSGRSSLPNAHAQKMFDAEAASLQNRVTMASAASAGDAFKSKTLGVANAQLDQAERAWVNPLDDKEFNSKVENVRTAMDTAQGISGWDDAKRNDEEFKAISRLERGRNHAIAQSDPQRALEMLDNPKNKMTDIDAQAARDFAYGQNRIVGAQFVAAQVYDPNKTLKQMEDDARALAPKFAHGDAQFMKHAVDAVKNQEWVENNALNRQFAQAKLTIDEAINTGKYKTPQEMVAAGLGPQIDAMRPSDKNKLQADITNFLKHKDEVSNREHFDKLWTMSQQFPMQFLNEDLWKDGMTIEQRGRLIQLRKAIIKSGGGAAVDPQVQKAAAFITKIYPQSIPKDRTSQAYATFMGSLQGALEDYSEDQKRKLGPQDWEKIGKALVQPVPGTGWFSPYKVYEEPVPADRMKGFKDQGMSEEEAIYTYHRQRGMQSFQELFGGTKK